MVSIPVPPVKSTSNPSVIPTLPPESPKRFQEVYAPAGVAQTLSPLRNVVPLGVPVADKSPEIVPEPVIVPPVTFTNVPLEVATLNTVPMLLVNGKSSTNPFFTFPSVASYR